MHFLCPDHRKRLSPLALLVLLVLFSLLHASCRKKEEAAGPPKYSYEKTYSRGGAEVILQLDRQSLNVAEHGELVLSVTCPEQWTPSVTAPGSDPEGLTITEIDRVGPNLLDSNLTRTRFVFRLRPFLPGKEEIGPFQIHIAEPNAEPMISTEPIPLTVVSLLPDKKTASLHDIAPPLAMANYLPLYLAAGGLAFLLLLAVGWGLLRRAKKEELPPPLPPHQLAHQALDRLLASGLIDQGQLAVFFKELSDILRRYIEARFSVRAPEQTTEEFLQAMATTPSFRPADRALLQNFLTHCDLIKFARLEPTMQEGRDRLQLCRRFIDETAAFLDARDESGGPP